MKKLCNISFTVIELLNISPDLYHYVNEMISLC